MQNIILLITDTYRYDNLLESSGVRTPNLDRFAAERGVSVTGMHAGSFPTIPHRTDLTTGRTGWPTYGWQAISKSSPNELPKLVAGQGYATQLICDCPHLFKTGFNLAFDAAYQERGQEADRPFLHLNHPIVRIVPFEKTRRNPSFLDRSLPDVHRWTNRYSETEAESFSARTASNVIRWLEENYRAGPFLLWADFFDPHEPWDPPEYLVRKYDPDYEGVPMLHPNYGPVSEYTDAELANLTAHYRAEATLVDRWLGRVVEKIDDLGLWENSVVVITSDHGMSLGEHGRTGKTNIHPEDRRFWPIYPEIGHVPFLIAAPGVPAGAELHALMQPVDILPTLADLADFSVAPFPEPIDGRSFAEAIRSSGSITAAAGIGREYVVSGGNLPESSLKNGATTPFLTSGKWGYAPVGAQGRPELYDLDADPFAEENIAADRSETVRELHGMFEEHLERSRAPEQTIDLLSLKRIESGEFAVE